jgi:CheY-like chemotaxis protein
MPLILLIEDDIQFHEMLHQMLTNEGYDVHQAFNGSDGISCYHKTPADLVITDILMPEKTGLETISELKRVYPEIKIIAMSGGGPANVKLLEIAKALGAKAILRKPFSRAELLESIENVLGD